MIYFKLLIQVIFVSCLVTLSCCQSKSDPAPDVQEVQLGRLIKTWSATQVTLDNVAQTGFSNFKITLTGIAGATSYSYTALGRPDNNPWQGSGTWVFGDPVETAIIRDKNTSGELPITYALTDTQLKLSFLFKGKGYSAGKISNVEGQWVFTFSPN